MNKPLPIFKNEPFRDFSEAHNREALISALQSLSNQLSSGPLEAAPIINGETLPGVETYIRSDPSDTRITVGKIQFADINLADKALSVCKAGFNSWRNTPFQVRSETLHKIANAMRAEKARLTAIIIREGGKPWKEADADVAEAIDFCDYYALHMHRYGDPVLTEDVLGEDNYYFYQPRGVAVVISPWNFPLAITCGMAVAALVTGNTVILKPSEQTSIIAYHFAKLCYEAGVPRDVLAFLPGRGEVIGRYLVNDSRTDLIAFTGSKPVGLEIIRSAYDTKPTQTSIKRVIAELGGKNAIVVDADADLDDAIRGIMYSAFGFSGQKCSACSRLLIVGDAYQPLVERLSLAISDILIGSASDPATLVGPVIDLESKERIENTIAQGKESLTLAAQGKLQFELREQGNFVTPTLFTDVPTDHPIWTEEIFGPVLACRQVQSFKEGIKLATDSQYALTGGVFTRSPSNLEYAKHEFRVGNLYLNRGCTGALVGRQPFGGFKLSGIGSKAGGPDYLLQFMEPRCLSENTMRRGFTPDLA